MEIRKLIAFARQQPAISHTFAQTPAGFDNLRYIGKLEQTIHELSKQKPDTFTFTDDLTAHLTHAYLKRLIRGQRDETINPVKIVTEFITVIHKLRDAHYAPMAAEANKQINNLKTLWDALNVEYEHLIRLTNIDINYADTLHDKFYIEGDWALDLQDEYAKLKQNQKDNTVISLSQAETHRNLRKIFRDTIQEKGTDFLELTIPNKLNTISMTQQQAIEQASKHERAISALNALTTGLHAAIHPHPSKILNFPVRRGARPR